MKAILMLGARRVIPRNAAGEVNNTHRRLGLVTLLPAWAAAPAGLMTALPPQFIFGHSQPLIAVFACLCHCLLLQGMP